MRNKTNTAMVAIKRGTTTLDIACVTAVNSQQARQEVAKLADTLTQAGKDLTGCIGVFQFCDSPITKKFLLKRNPSPTTHV